MKNIVSAVLLLFCFTLLNGQVTFTKDVAKIIYNKCTNCHRPGEVGPFPLMNYTDAKLRAQGIKLATKSKFMPPWKPDPTFSRHLGENFLTDEEIKKISDWVDGGAPYGIAAEEPRIPDFPKGSALGTPDLVVSFAKKHLHKGDKKDKYRYFVLPTNLPEDKIIKAVEVRPGNGKIVHHALIFQDFTGKARSFDAKTPEYGFEGMSGFTVEEAIFYDQYPGYAPGQKALYFPDGIGQSLKKGADIVLQMHYAPSSTDESDSTTVNLFFANKNETVSRTVDDLIMLPFHLVSGAFSFIIPANSVSNFEGRMVLNEDRSLIGLFPHMHLLGKKWEVWLERPDKTRENLVKINDWDFNWQSNYYFTKYIKAPNGSVIVAKAVYDNTTSNPSNPTSPPRRVSWGENTTDEMFYLPILSVPYRPGDENIVFSTPTSTNEILNRELESQLYDIIPNPISDENINVRFYLDRGQSIQFGVYDINGRLVRLIRANEYFDQGEHSVPINTGTLANGAYFVKLQSNHFNSSKSLIVSK
jgi:hypothetical protein